MRSAGRPISVRELASLLALHPNTVRFHAQALEAAGLLSQRQEATGGKGRPWVLYEATPRGLRAGKQSYLLLATMLLEWLIRDSADPVGAAQAAGRNSEVDSPAPDLSVFGGELAMSTFGQCCTRWLGAAEVIQPASRLSGRDRSYPLIVTGMRREPKVPGFGSNRPAIVVAQARQRPSLSRRYARSV